jgi:hypothetical protein
MEIDLRQCEWLWHMGLDMSENITPGEVATATRWVLDKHKDEPGDLRLVICVVRVPR